MQLRKPYVSTKHFKVRLFDKKGEEFQKEKERIYTVEFTEFQDTVDLLPYFCENGTYYVVVLEGSKPALLLRPDIIKELDDLEPTEKEYILDQPSAVIQSAKNEYGVSDTINRILLEKLPGLEVVKHPEILGGSYFPSVGSSTEIVFPRAVEIKPHKEYKHVTDSYVAYVLSLQEIITLYAKQEKLFSTRLIELVFRLADKLHIDLSVPYAHIEVPNWSKDAVLKKNRFIDRDSLRSILEDDAPLGSRIDRVGLEEVESPKIPFLLTTHFRAEASTPSGEKVTREVDILIRKKIDSIDVGGYFVADGKLYMPIKWGVRPSLAVRNLMPHPVHTDASIYFIEGIAGSLEGEHALDDLMKRGVSESEEEVSLTNSHPPQYLGFDYPSAGHNPERVYRIMLPLDPTKDTPKEQNEEETARIVYASIEDILTLSHEGVIRDPRLSLNAHIIKCMYQNTPYKVGSIDSTTDDLFENLVHQQSEVQKWLSLTSKSVDDLLSESSLYRKLKHYGENELGVAVMKLSHEKEAHFFSPMVPLFATPSTNQENKLPFYYLHDLFHYATTGFVPLLRKGKTLTMCTFDEYMRATCGNECEAVWYSDVLIPEEFGVDKAEQIFNGDSVARAFGELGISTDDARNVIREIELEGKIRDDVKNHPLFGRFKGVFINRLLRYHIMDTESNKVMYEYWKQNLDLAQVMEDFCDVFSSVEEYEQYYKDTIIRIMNYTEGVNPLRAYLSHMLNVRIRLLALKFAYARHELKDHALKNEITDHLENMKEVYKEIKESKKQLMSIDPTKKNKQIIRRVRELEETVVIASEKYLESLIKNETLPSFLRKDLQDRTVPFFEPFAELDKDTLAARIKELEAYNGL